MAIYLVITTITSLYLAILWTTGLDGKMEDMPMFNELSVASVVKLLMTLLFAFPLGVVSIVAVAVYHGFIGVKVGGAECDWCPYMQTNRNELQKIRDRQECTCKDRKGEQQ